MERATISFPVPLSPRISTGWELLAAFGDDAVKLLDLRSAAHQATVTLPGLQLPAQHPVFGFQLEMVGDALQQQLEFVNTEGLGNVFVSALLHGLHCRLHRTVSSHDDDRSFRNGL